MVLEHERPMENCLGVCLPKKSDYETFGGHPGTPLEILWKRSGSKLKAEKQSWWEEALSPAAPPRFLSSSGTPAQVST